MISTIRHVGLVVSDLDKALQFWCETMGFVISRQMEEAGKHLDVIMGLNDVRVTTAKLADPDGNLLELLCFASHLDKDKWISQPYSTGFTHIALTVSDVDEMCHRLRNVGLDIPIQPQYSPDGCVKVIYVRGPEGILIELVELLE
ncbi:VOC family protein [Planktomarina temperata]|nr:VOC family protein [Planktomarina temperata]